MRTIDAIRWAVVGLALGFGPTPVAFAAATATGVIEGQVIHAITGRALENARITVPGTDLRTFSDDTGRYRLGNVPAGVVNLEVFYTGLDQSRVLVQLQPGQTQSQDVKLSNAALFGMQDSTTKLDAFTVESARITDQASIAINEQRFAPNIKSVIATGDISEQPDGNIGEFLKMMPGVAPGGGGTVPSAIYIRGFPPSTTQITVDGGSMASTTFGAPDRQVQVSNETPGTGISRIEVTKVPTPATGADTMAGSVNMVTRTAFEANRPQLTYAVYGAGVLSEIGLRHETGWEERQFRVQPGFSLRYTNPVSKNFGYAISASASSRQRPTDGNQSTHNYNSPTFGSSPSAPLLQTMAYNTGSAIFEMGNVQLRADWRVAPNSILSGSFETYHWRGLTESFTSTRNAGNNATPTITGGAAGTFGEDFTRGAIGRGVISSGNSYSLHNKGGVRGNVRYGFNNGDWKVDLHTAQSKARFWRNDGLGGEFGTFSTLTTSAAAGTYRVDFLDVDPKKGPATIKVYEANGQEVDVNDRNFMSRSTVTQAQISPRYSTDRVQEYKADIKRTLGFLPFPASVQIGGALRERDLDYQELTRRFTYAGVGGNLSALPFVTMREYNSGQSNGKTIPMASPVLAYRAWKENPALFYETPAQIAETERLFRFGSERIKEKAEALYFQADGRFFDSRLSILAGVRYEKTTAEGAGSLNSPDAVWRRNPDGSYVIGANGVRVRKPEAGAVGSLQEIQLTWLRRAARSERSYDDLYPSVHLNYNVSDNMIARAAFAQTYGRPNFSFIVPRTVVNETIDSDGDITSGRLTVRNIALLPWTANNYDLSLEYYTDQGGVFGVGLFRKEVKNFFGSVQRPATVLDLQEAGVDPATVDVSTWLVNTTVNSADADVNGFEVSMNHSLRPLGRWLGPWVRHFNLFANATKLRISGPGASELSGFLPFGWNGGIRFSRKPIMISVNANYRGDETTGVNAAIGPNGRNYRPARTHIDAAMAITLGRNVEFFFNVRNLFNKEGGIYKESDVLPAYAARTSSSTAGAVFNAGIKGTF